MFELTRSVVVEAPAEAVWQVIADGFDRIGQWATAIPASAAYPVPDPATGAPVPGRVCRTGVALVPEVTETIVAFDDAGRSLTYEATAGMPAFVTLARNRWQVTAVGDRARVGRTGRYLLDDLKYHVEHGVASPRKRRQLARSAGADARRHAT